MKGRRRRLIVVVTLILLFVTVGVCVRISRPSRRGAARAERLVAELRKAQVAIPTSLQEAFAEPRDPEVIAADLAVLGEPAVPVLIQTLQAPDPYMRRWAATALGQMAPPATNAIPSLMALLGDPDALALLAAQTALAEIGPAAVPPLVRHVADTAASATLRGRAATVLAMMKPPPGEALDAFRRALHATDDQHHAWAAHALAQAGATGIPFLTHALAHRQRSTRLWAAIALKSIGPSAAAAGPALVKALSDENREVAIMAAEALATTGDKGVRLLTEAYNDGNRTVRDRAVWGLGRTGPDAREQVVPTLIGALDDEDTDVRRTVAWALREVTGRDFGDEPKRWSEWWAQER